MSTALIGVNPANTIVVKVEAVATMVVAYSVWMSEAAIVEVEHTFTVTVCDSCK